MTHKANYKTALTQECISFPKVTVVLSRTSSPSSPQLLISNDLAVKSTASQSAASEKHWMKRSCTRHVNHLSVKDGSFKPSQCKPH